MYHYNNKAAKLNQYINIINTVKESGIIPETALTMPGESGFAFEHLLSETFSKIVINCAEQKHSIYLNQLEYSSNNMYPMRTTIETVCIQAKKKFDIVWFDFNGATKLNQPTIEQILNKESVFAITECKDRKCKKMKVILNTDKFTPYYQYEYGHMRFRCFHYKKS